MKKSFLIYTLFLSFIIMIDTAYAENEYDEFGIKITNEIPELTCIYEAGKTQFPILYTQDSSGRRIIAQIDKKKHPEAAKNPTKNSEYWTIIFDETDTDFVANTKLIYENRFLANKLIRVPVDGKKVLRAASCPPCVNHKSNIFGKVSYTTSFSNYYSAKSCEGGYTSLITDTEEKKFTANETININKISSSSELSDDQKNKMYNCKYDGANFYISDDDQKVYTDIPNTEINGQSMFSNTIKFSRDEFLSDYKENKSTEKCPRTLYKKCTNVGPSAAPVTSCEWYVTFQEPTSGYTTKAILKTSETGKEKEENKENIKSCKDLFSPSTIKEIDKIMGLVRIAVPIILIVFGIIDFFRATFSDNEDNMKKDRERFIKRIIAAIIVFIVPMFVHLVLTIANNVWGYINPETCVK